MTHPSVLEKRSLPEESSVPFEMACPHRATTATDADGWTAASLLSALLELLIAFLFLAGATISFLTFKLIRFLGLQPPCFDRGRTLPESRSNLQKIVRPQRLPKELSTPSHCCLHEKHLKNCECCEPQSPCTSCSQFDSPSPLEQIRRDQLSFTCRRCPPQLVRKRSNCVRRFDPKHQETTNYEDIATTEDKSCDICPYCCHGHGSASRGSIRRRLPRTKKRPDGVVLEDCLDLCGGSNDDSIAGSEADGVRQMERERNFKVFPEDLIDLHSWNQENEGNRFVESSQDTIAHRQLSGADSIHAPETSIQHCPDKQETPGDLQLTGEYLGLPTEPLIPKVEYEGAPGPIRSSDFCSAEEQSTSKAGEPGYRFGNGFEDVSKPVSQLENGNLIDYMTTPGEENSWGGVDDDSNKLKEKLALERETLNRVYLELEKERTASASAADEAMAMITRLQEDKAALQLEAVQYQRMAEEKALCDEEAIVVLRDFLLKREAEKLCLEKEIEFYKRKFSTSRSKSAKRRERRDETGDALLCEDADKGTFPLMKPKDCDGNAAFVAVPDDQSWKRVCSYGALSGHKTSLFSVKSDTLLQPSNPPARQGNPTSSHSSGDRSPKTGKDAEDQSNDFQAAACHERPYSPVRANGHEIRPGTPKDQEDANDEDHCGDCQAAAFHCRSYSSTRVNGHEIRSGRKSRGIPERQWQHILERIWSLEEQIHRLKLKHNLSVELSLGALSGHGMKQRPSKEKRKTLDHKLSQNEPSANRSVGHRKFGTNDHGKRLIRANESGEGVSSTSKTGMHNLSIANGTPAFVNLTMESAEEIERGIQVSSETTEQIEVPDAFFEPLMDAETSTQAPSVTTASPLFGSSLEPECLIQDERTAEDEVNNNDSAFLSTRVSRLSLSDFRATMTVSESNTALKTEVQGFVSRLQELQADREVMRQVMESMRKERERIEFLEIGAQELLQEREGSAVCEEAAETCQTLQDDSSIEAERSAEKEQCFSKTSSEEILAEDMIMDAGSCVDGSPLISNLEPHS